MCSACSRFESGKKYGWLISTTLVPYRLYCLCSFSREVNNFLDALIYCVWDAERTVMFRKLQWIMRFDAVLKLKTVHFVKRVNNFLLRGNLVQKKGERVEEDGG